MFHVEQKVMVVNNPIAMDEVGSAVIKASQWTPEGTNYLVLFTDSDTPIFVNEANLRGIN